MEIPGATSAPDRLEFEQMCAEIDEFEPLPWVANPRLERAGQEGEEETSFDGQILAGLVSPY
ncbi:MAG: hypothetical protein JO244_05605 [Solirubrobacterales bacterium]|nr:hypothetical protein [Solirubrobacterales bacterium]